MPCEAAVSARAEVHVCSVPQLAHSNAVDAVTGSDMVEMGGVVAGTGACCMVPVLVD